MTPTAPSHHLPDSTDPISLVQEPVTGLWYRPSTYDLPIIRERRSYLELGIEHSDTVLDVGACLGSFAYHALVDRQASICYSFEPDPDNFSLLKRNSPNILARALHHPSLQLAQCALIPTPPSPDPIQTYLYRNWGTNKGMHSLVPRRGRTPIAVWGLSFTWALQQYRPTVVKVDVEGAEWDLFSITGPTVDHPPLLLPPYVQKLAVELHRNRRRWTYLVDPFRAYLAQQGFIETRSPTHSGWATLGIWRR